MKFISITPENNNASEFIDVTSKMPAFVKLYSPTCGHCIAMQEAWDALKDQSALNDYNMAIIEVHADELDKIDSPAMTVNGGFPTIRKVLKNGKLGKDYDGDRSIEDMVNFIKKEFKETQHKNKTHQNMKRTKMNGAKMNGAKMNGGKKMNKSKRKTIRKRKSKMNKSKRKTIKKSKGKGRKI
jgi:hypothetical protein